jgi:hypothetical protein
MADSSVNGSLDMDGLATKLVYSSMDGSNFTNVWFLCLEVLGIIGITGTMLTRFGVLCSAPAPAPFLPQPICV